MPDLKAVARELMDKYHLMDGAAPNVSASEASPDKVVLYFHGTYEMTPDQAEKVLIAFVEAGVI